MALGSEGGGAEWKICRSANVYSVISILPATTESSNLSNSSS